MHMKTLSDCGRHSAAALLVALSMLQVTVARADAQTMAASDVKQLLLSGRESARSVFADIKVRYEKTETLHEEVLREFDPSVKSGTVVRENYIRKGRRERLDGEVKGGASRTWIHDGQMTLTHYPTKGTDDTATQVGRAYRQPEKLGLMARGRGPVRLLGYKPGCMPTDVLNSPKARIATAVAMRNGRVTYEVTAPILINKVEYAITYWLAVDRNAAPVRMELRSPDGSLMKTLETKEFTRLSNGVWLPKTVVLAEYVPGEKASRVAASHRYVVTDVELGPKVDDSAFFTDERGVPQGYLFDDIPSGLEYTIGQGPMSDERIRRLVDRAVAELGLPSSQAVATAAQDASQPLLSPKGFHEASETDHSAGSDAGLSGGRLWLLIGLCLAAVSGIGIVIARSRKRRRVA